MSSTKKSRARIGRAGFGVFRLYKSSITSVMNCWAVNVEDAGVGIALEDAVAHRLHQMGLPIPTGP